ncbi:unnamed protein product [Strongylus vulgaris]|uniref:Uncharacterized protein n=1 Tax=Strongylus vulgaris TaxID=40348 RepID=A0A3P7JUH9_STRVU|nr:unnamed protein product [Strongylus vulgaris]
MASRSTCIFCPLEQNTDGCMMDTRLVAVTTTPTASREQCEWQHSHYVKNASNLGMKADAMSAARIVAKITNPSSTPIDKGHHIGM